MLGAVFLALAGPGFVNSEVPDPDGPMEISNLVLSTANAGACPVPPAAPIPSPSASIRLDFRALNRDDAAYRVDVYLDVPGPFPTQQKLGSANPDGIGGFAPIEWSQGWADIVSGFGVFHYNGYIELVGGALPGYTRIALENDTVTLAAKTDVAYGANGRFIFRSVPAGDITFNNTTFTDPLVGTLKAGFAKLPGFAVDAQTTDWTFRVQLVRLIDDVVVATLRAPWRKTYGICG